MPVAYTRTWWHLVEMCLDEVLWYFFVNFTWCIFHVTTNFSFYIIQRRGRQRRSASVPNILTVFLLFARRPTAQTYPILIRKSISFRLIWLWVNSIMWLGSVSNLHQKRHSSYSVPTQSHPMQLSCQLFTRSKRTRMVFCTFNTVESLRLETSIMVWTIHLGTYCVNIWSSYIGLFVSKYPAWDCLLVVVVH